MSGLDDWFRDQVLGDTEPKPYVITLPMGLGLTPIEPDEEGVYVITDVPAR